jgi:hypothetical protein
MSADIDLTRRAACKAQPDGYTNRSGSHDRSRY